MPTVPSKKRSIFKKFAESPGVHLMSLGFFILSIRQ